MASSDTSAEINDNSSPAPAPAAEKAAEKIDKPWLDYISEDFKAHYNLSRKVQESTDYAIRSFQNTSSNHVRSLKDFLPEVSSQYKAYEEAFFQKVKAGLINAREHPALVGGIIAGTSLLLMRGPRRFLFRNTLGRFQSAEAQFDKAQKNVNDLKFSVDSMKKESRKLLERAAKAKEEMTDGHSELMNAGTNIQSLAKAVNKAEAQATDLMELLREIPNREALKLRAEVASMASDLRQQKAALNERVTKISELGLPV